MIHVMFVCHGNICRSPMAECILTEQVRRAHREGKYEIRSAATSREEIGNGLYPPAAAKLREKGIPCIPHRARQFTPSDYDWADVVFYMDGNNLFRLRGLCPDRAGKYRCLADYIGSKEIADPWYTGDFERTYRDLEGACAAFLRESEQ